MKKIPRITALALSVALLLSLCGCGASDGKTHLNDFLKVLGLDDDYLDEVKGEAETIAGLMLEIRKDFLRQGERLSYRDLKLKVEAVAGRRIDKIEVTFGPTPPAEG